MKERKSFASRRWIGVVAGTGLALASIWFSQSFVAAQQQPGLQFGPRGRWLPPDPADGDTSSDVFLPPDRSVLRQWEKAKARVDESRWSEAVVLVEELLEGSEDYFFKPDAQAAGKPATYRSVKAEAQKLIGDLPLEGRKAYELQFGTKANQLLTAAATIYPAWRASRTLPAEALRHD